MRAQNITLSRSEITRLWLLRNKWQTAKALLDYCDCDREHEKKRILLLEALSQELRMLPYFCLSLCMRMNVDRADDIIAQQIFRLALHEKHERDRCASML